MVKSVFAHMAALTSRRHFDEGMSYGKWQKGVVVGSR